MYRSIALIAALLSPVTMSCAHERVEQRSAHSDLTSATTPERRPQPHRANLQVAVPRATTTVTALSCADLRREVQQVMDFAKSGAYRKSLDLATKAQDDASKPNPCKDDEYAEGSARLAELDLVQSYTDAKLGKNDQAMAKYEIAEGDASGCYESPALRDANIIEQCRRLHDTLEQNHDATMITLGNIPRALVP